jgi:hypothetical protein
MEDDHIGEIGVCRRCGCSQSQAMANARGLDFQTEFQDGIYSCCQLMEWTKEQWLAWLEAGREELHKKEIKRPLESGEFEEQLLPVRIRTRKEDSRR